MIKEYIRYLKDNTKGYWFKASLYGWGWTPAKKEGWIALLVYLLVMIAPALLAIKFAESGDKFLWWFVPLIIIANIGATMALIWISSKKGEKP